MPAFERAWEFDRRLQERSATRVQRFDRGAALYTGSLPRVYDGNFIRLDSVDLSADEVERLADSLQRDMRHRKLVLPSAGAGLAGELVRRGWSLSRIATMVYGGPPQRDAPAAAAAELVDPRAIRGAREGALAGRDADLRRQVAEYTERLAVSNDGQVFAAFAEGEVGAFCALFQENGVGEIDEVTTLDRFRKRGLGNAVVEAALNASLASKNDLTFLNADADDWPKRWYERMGFGSVGLRYEVYRRV